MQPWKRNLLFICLAQLATMVGFSTYGSFIPYYLQELGVDSYEAALAWTAAFNCGASTAMMIAAPIWGRLADLHGRKLMLVRATAAGTVLAALMSLVTDPAQLIVIRIAQGALCGTMGAAMTLVATGTPERNLASSLGALQTTQYVGMAIGPMIGGFLADATNYRSVFPMAAAFIGSGLLAIILGVREVRKPKQAVKEDKPKVTIRSAIRIRGIVSGTTMLLIGALASTSFAMAVLVPIIPLYIQVLVTDSDRLATTAGLIASVSAISTAISAMVIGRLADRIGLKRVLVACVVGVAATFVPQALVDNPTQLIMLRIVQGVFVGGILPTANALLAVSTPQEHRGTIFGLTTSMQSGGNALGPIIGAGVASLWGLTSGFYLTAVIFAILATVLQIFVKPNLSRYAKEPSPEI